ncbi:hypothetical protein Z517_01978 [Fonsecaea pedrosoi CBS 271.37]|uniref:FAS1 domain-containing protein n=1 Tax=Fonsecaea pedrosoi CBS 271.37 TaxID=1442368 RepID=A0A0D2GVU4_9EURO|nr:uncharacterized protein Z517_01978 [Fonsecaea pedrosoi CBS 271.37]KIW82735.1 hypothetical protein Z517_01978 [Fonsecaea pedrosoi CBS 271.37]
MLLEILATLTTLAGATLGQSSPDLATVLNTTDGTSTLGQVVSQSPGFLEAISGKTNLTFLAPNDTAIALWLNSSQGQAASDAGDDYLTNLLLYHTINGGYNNISDYFVAHTLLTSDTLTNVSGGQFIAGYYDDDDNVTTFLSGDYNDSSAGVTPLSFAQGWIYIIDSVLSVPQIFSEVAVADDFNGTSFVAALDSIGLTEQFNSLHDATYFVPYDSGWSLVEDALSQLSKDNLTEVLKYHACEQILLFDDWANGTQVTTLTGETVTFTQTPDEEWFINNAGVSSVNLFSSGGVIVLIDSVMNPYKGFAQPLNGTDGDGVPAWPVTNATSTEAASSSTVSATGSIATATYSGAAVPLKTDSVGLAVFLGYAALAIL